MLILSKTKHGVTIYISVLKRIGEYFCEVYLEHPDLIAFEDDTFTISNKEIETFKAKEVLEYIQKRCDEYALNLDDMRILNKKFNEVYETISEAHNLLNDFYMNYIYCNENSDVEDLKNREQMVELFKKMSEVKEIAHEVAEHYTWDK